MMATIDAVHIMNTNKELAIRVFARYTNTKDREIWESAYQAYLASTENVPYIKPDGVKVAMDMLAELGLAAKGQASDFIDNSLVEEIEHSGFVEKLYRQN